MRFFLTFVFASAFAFSHAQDSLQVLTLDRFLAQVSRFHPMARQAKLQPERGEAMLRAARGNFDPKANVGYDRKAFDGNEYYGLFNATLSVPTWYGLEVKAGYESAQGVYVNPENALPLSGLAFAGIKIPLGQGLLIDQRRTELAKGKLYAEAGEYERQRMMNDLLFEAGQAWLEWVQATAEKQVVKEALQLSNQRFLGVRQSALSGDKPFIDTLESWIQVQNFQIALIQAEVKQNNARLKASVYLWDEADRMLEISEKAIAPPPDDFPMRQSILSDSLEMMVGVLTQSHPELLMAGIKTATSELDRRWYAEKLKPKVDITYNMLQAPVGNQPFAGMTPNNYKAGIGFSMPVFLREERGRLADAKIKVQENSLSQIGKRAELETKVRTYANELQALAGQVNVYETTVKDYERMLDGERRKFSAGESSVFVVNSREQYYLSARLKLIEWKAKQTKAGLSLKWAAGNLWEMP